MKRSRSLVSLLLGSSETDDSCSKAKNIQQTELLVDLREAILQVARHFQSIDPKNHKVVSIGYFVLEGTQSRIHLIKTWNIDVRTSELLWRDFLIFDYVIIFFLICWDQLRKRNI